MVKISEYPQEIVHRITAHLLSVLHLGDLGGNIDRRRRKNASGILLHRALVALPLLDLGGEDTRRDTIDRDRERSGSVVECLTRDRRAALSSLTGFTALWSLSKTHLF